MTNNTAARKMTKAEAGRLGGRATHARWGSEHMSEIGARGQIATVEAHWAGDTKGMMEHVRSHLTPMAMVWCARNLCYVLAQD